MSDEMTDDEINEWDYVSSAIGDTISLEAGPDENGAFIIKEEQFINLVNLVIEMRRPIKWLPIETAPKDGSFLVWLSEEDLVHSTHVGVARYHPNVKTISGRFDHDMSKPNYWQPLPDPPIEL